MNRTRRSGHSASQVAAYPHRASGTRRSPLAFVHVLTLAFFVISMMSPLMTRATFAQDTGAVDASVVAPDASADAPVDASQTSTTDPVASDPVTAPAPEVTSTESQPVVETTGTGTGVTESAPAPAPQEPAPAPATDPVVQSAQEPAPPADLTDSVDVAVAANDLVVADASAVSCVASDAAVSTIASDKADYPPGALVTLTGTGWAAGQTVRLFIDDDGVADDEMGEWSISTEVTALVDGSIFYQFNLPKWFVADYFVTATGECSTATTAFTDGYVNMSASVGLSPITVLPSAKFTASVTVGMVNNGDAWQSTRWNIGGLTDDCDETANASGQVSSTTTSFDVTAPGDVGTYDATFTVYKHAGCSGPSAMQTLPGAVNVAKGSTTVTNVGGTATYGQPATLVATVSQPGTVQFQINSVNVGSPVAVTTAGGVATLTGVSHTFAAGTHTGVVKAIFTPTDTAKYSGSDGTGALVVTKASQAALTVTGPGSGTYGDVLVPAATGGSSTGAVTFAATGTACQIPTTGDNAGKLVITSGTGSCSITATKAGDGNYNQATSAAFAVTIAKASQATLEVTSPTSGTYGQTLTLTSAGGSGTGLVTFAVAAGDVCTVAGNQLTITSGTGTCSVTATKAGDANYNQATSAAFAVTIAKANQAVTFGPQDSKTFGDAPFEVSATAPGGTVTFALASDSTGCTLDGAEVTITSGTGTCKVTGSVAESANYNAASATQSIPLAKANQAITFGALSPKTYGDEAFTASATASSGLAVTFALDTDSTGCTLSGTTVTITGAGDCTITASQAGDDNYNAATSITQAFNIAKASQTINFSEIADQTFANPAPTVTLSATASSGLAVTFALGTDSTGCTLSGTTVTITGAGDCTVMASQAGNTNYNAAPDVARTFAIGKASQTITFAAISTKKFGDAPFPVSASSDSSLPLTLTVEGNCTVAGTTVTITGAGSCKITASQAGNANYNAALNAERTFTIDKGKAVMTFSGLTASEGQPHEWNGQKKVVTVTTTPAELETIAITYTDAQGITSTEAPAKSGTYQVTAKLDNPNYEGETTGTLVIKSKIVVEGPFQPIDLGVFNTAKGGSTIPVKFKIKIDGNYVTTSQGLTIALSTKAATCDVIDGSGLGNEVALEQTTTGSTSVRYDSTSGHWIYNWKTSKVVSDQCHVLYVTVQAADGSVDSTDYAYIKLKK